MDQLPNCPHCHSTLTYEDRGLFICPECSYEWTTTVPHDQEDRLLQVKDVHGQLLQDGDTVTVVKDLKVKGASSPLKVGTKVRSIRLVSGDHNIDCKIEGFGALKLKSEFVKKS